MNNPFIVVIGMGADGPAGLAGEPFDTSPPPAFSPGPAPPRILRRMGRRDDRDRRRRRPAHRRLREVYLREKTVVLASGDPLFHGIGRAC